MMTSIKADRDCSFSVEPHGTVTGQVVVDKATGKPLCNRYLGVPYALPPTGPRRWQKPQPLPNDFSYASKKYDTFVTQCLQPKYTHEYSIEPPEPPKQSEDCLYLNMWTPCGAPPPGGWPIWFQIHGGWLQIGDANQNPLKDLAHLIAPREDGGQGLQAVVVFPAYRLNVFGFLSSDALDKDTGRGNFGFLDQRFALEWVHRHARGFGGDPGNITVSGLSAGAQSSHAQVLYEYSLAQTTPNYRPLIRRCLLRSGTAMLPPKSFEEPRPQLRELAQLLDVKGSSDAEMLQVLRGVPADKLVGAIDQLKMHTFRSVDDGGPAEGGFVSSSWGKAMRSGAFSKWCKQNGITWIIGECADEDQLYRIINPPGPKPSYGESLLCELNNYYPPRSVQALLKAYDLPPQSTNDAAPWADIFGRITSDAQVFLAERLLVRYLVRPQEGGLTEDDVLRYRLERRAKFLDEMMPPHTGVFHGACEALFLYMKDAIASAQEGEGQRDLEAFEAFMRPVADWVRGVDQADVARRWSGVAGEEGQRAGGREPGSRMRILRADGTIEAAAQDPLSTKGEHPRRMEAIEEAVIGAL